MQNKTFVRVARDLIDIFSHKTLYKPSVSGSGSHVQLTLGDAALMKANDSPGQAGLKTASKLIEDGGELIRTPLKWIKDMQANWLIYMICAAIICLCLFYFYCMVRTYFARKHVSNTGLTSQLADVALMMANSRTGNSLNTNIPISTISKTDPTEATT